MQGPTIYWGIRTLKDLEQCNGWMLQSVPVRKSGSATDPVEEESGKQHTEWRRCSGWAISGWTDRGETGCCSPEEAWGRWGWKALTNPLEGLGLCLLGHGSNPKFGRRTETHKVRCTDYPLGVCMDRTFPSWSSLYPMGADPGMLRQSVFRGSRCRVISTWFGQHLVPRLVWNRFFTCRWFLYQATFCVF